MAKGHLMKSSALNIFKFTDYRIFLKEYYSARKKQKKRFSYRAFAKESGVSASLLKDIIEGRRNLTVAIMSKYAQSMGLNKKECSYFRILVEFTNAKTSNKKNEYLELLLKARKGSSLNFLDKSQYDFFLKWYHSPIREMVTLPTFKEDPIWIAKQLTPNITPAQAKKALTLLEKLDLLKRTSSGRLIQSDSAISAEYQLQNMSMRKFNATMIKLASEAIHRFELNEREISGLTLGVSNDCYHRIKQRIRIFKEELLKMVLDDPDNSQTVCQFNIQLFPLVEKEQEEETK